MDVSLGIDADRAQEVLRLAARLQDEAKSKLSVEELTGIAGEAGIEERYVRMALAAGQAKSVAVSSSVVPLKPWSLAFPLVAYAFSHLMIDFTAWGVNLFTTIGSRGVIALAIGIGTAAAYRFGKALPKQGVSYAQGVAVLIGTAFFLRVQTRFGWDLSLSLNSTLTLFMLTLASVCAFLIAHGKYGRGSQISVHDKHG